MFDLHPATQRTLDLAIGVSDDDLERPTPCPGTTVGDLIDHLAMFGRNFQAAARKRTSVDDGRPPAPSASNLTADWRERLRVDLEAMAVAWSVPEAWAGSTVAGSIELPADVVGLVALDELVVHGWDLAVATSQPYRPTEAEIAAATSFVASFEAPRDGSLFGPVVEVPADASAMERLLGLTGRDPGWRPVG